MINKFDKIYKQIISQQTNVIMPTEQGKIIFDYYFPRYLSDSQVDFEENQSIRKTDIYVAFKSLKTMVNNYNCEIVEANINNYAIYCKILVPNIDTFNMIVDTIPYVDNDYANITTPEDIVNYQGNGEIALASGNQKTISLNDAINTLKNIYDKQDANAELTNQAIQSLFQK